MIVETAPAKINLYLHIGPLRRDGLHDLASLFVFAEDGDVIRAAPSQTLSLDICGPYAHALAGLPPENNLVWRAAERLAALGGVEPRAAITLEKNLPIASGVGGGSADAAAALRALRRLWKLDVSDAALSSLAFSLGADVPACLARAPVNVSGAGEKLSPGPSLPPLWIALVNPRVAMPTGPVFRAFDAGTPKPQQPALAAPTVATYEALIGALKSSRNDLQPFAVARAGVVGNVIDALSAAPGALIARMSGSGATCFALFASDAAARRAAVSARARGWWALASRLHLR